MKTRFLLILCGGLQLANAQQRVGINETTPSATLEVKGAGTGSATTNFLIKNNSSSLILRSLDNGNIGVGTGSPQYILDVANRMRLREGQINNITTTPGMWLNNYLNGTESIFAGMEDSIRYGFYGGGPGGVGWGFNFNARNGNVGVGTTADGTYRLTLAGADYGIGLYNGTNNFYGSLTSAADNSLQIESPYGNNFAQTTPRPILLNPPSGNFFFTPGNVGINVTAPTARLQIGGNVMVGFGSPATGYQLSVNGKVICTEAKVQLNSAWPDYVFSETHQRPSLYQVEKFIQKNKHLPNIPSAAEVEKDGLLLGDMQKRLMEKVEELTLYMIELKKENDQLKKRVRRMEKRN